jgi:hypothetical protein
MAETEHHRNPSQAAHDHGQEGLETGKFGDPYGSGQAEQSQTESDNVEHVGEKGHGAKARASPAGGAWANDPDGNPTPFGKGLGGQGLSQNDRVPSLGEQAFGDVAHVQFGTAVSFLFSGEERVKVRSDDPHRGPGAELTGGLNHGHE